MRLLKRLLPLVVVLVMGGATLVVAQITVPFPTFTAGTTIDPDQMNSNFSTLSSQALNRTGGTVTGNIAASANVTVDGADISDYLDGSGNLTVPGTSAFTGVATFTAAIPGATMTTPTFTNYAETYATASISTNTLALNLDNGNHFSIALNANITTFTVSNIPTGKAVTVTMIFTADGTIRTITWPASVKWPAATAPTMTGTNGKVDIITLYTVDAGTTWYAVLGGQNF